MSRISFAVLIQLLFIIVSFSEQIHELLIMIKNMLTLYHKTTGNVNFSHFSIFFYWAKLDVIFFLHSFLTTKNIFPFDLWWKNIFCSQKMFFHFFCTFFPLFLLFFPSKTLLFLRKNLKSEKNILFQFFIHVTVFSKMFPHLIWHFQSYLGRKKGTSETFLSLGLFISRPRPAASASKIRPRLW